MRGVLFYSNSNFCIYDSFQYHINFDNLEISYTLVHWALSCHIFDTLEIFVHSRTKGNLLIVSISTLSKLIISYVHILCKETLEKVKQNGNFFLKFKLFNQNFHI